MFSVIPNQVIFYEKTGCSGNKRQKELLREYGVSLEVRSLLDTAWDKESLSDFFEGLMPKDMINPFAPNLKDGTFKLEDYTKEILLEKMVQEPIHILRPL
jgi:arsenate reductase-like glutaredoxin family protein